MADVFTTIRQGEKDLIYSPEYDPDSGTLTFASGTVTLYSASGAVAGGVSDAAVTDFTSGASSAPQGWWLMDLTSGGLTLTPGNYELAFTMVDSNGRKRISVVGVTVKTPYDP